VLTLEKIKTRSLAITFSKDGEIKWGDITYLSAAELLSLAGDGLDELTVIFYNPTRSEVTDRINTTPPSYDKILLRDLPQAEDTPDATKDGLVSSPRGINAIFETNQFDNHAEVFRECNLWNKLSCVLDRRRRELTIKDRRGFANWNVVILCSSLQV
jgi:hypothetical protein